MRTRSPTHGSSLRFVWRSWVTLVSIHVPVSNSSQAEFWGGTVLKNYKLTSLKTIISSAAPLSAQVQLMLHKKYNTGGRAVHVIQGTSGSSRGTNASDPGAGDHHRIWNE